MRSNPFTPRGAATTRRNVLAGAGIGLVAPILAAPALAQPRWPERPIEVMVGFTAAGGTDIMARAYARFLE
jgi:tripartite-type tricarboxylate transporter receptor subunit TctC